MTTTKLSKSFKNIYCISGLGADKRVFQKLKFRGYQPVHLDWLEPNKGEDIASYAQRLAGQITAQKPILIGLSFGGIVAIEIAKHIAVEKVILISSAKSSAEIPFYFQIFRWLPLHCVIPFKSLLFIVYWLIYWFFSLENSQERQLLKAILIDTDAQFLKWAIHRVVIWNNQTVPDCTYHLHGTSDRIFPLRFVKPDIKLEQGGHFMIINRADKISQIIDRIIVSDKEQ
ncbi:MAG TPA: alpha/beta hydrolase [Xenococcaceae cyanobacterium]